MRRVATPHRGVRFGTGTACGHHGEILQGCFSCHGDSVPGLVTLPVASLRSHARFTPSFTRPGIRGQCGTKARRAAELMLDHLTQTQPRTPESQLPLGGDLTVECGISEGLGLGSSTADVVASMRAVAAALGSTVASPTLARLAVAAEGAADPVMGAKGAGVTLFAQREGRAIHQWRAGLPPMLLVGCQWGEPVETMRLHAERSQVAQRALNFYDGLADWLGEALASADARAVGEVATHSSLMNQAWLPNPHLPTLIGICGECGGVGVQVAHSGAVAGVLFDAHPECRQRSASRAQQCRTLLVEAGLDITVREELIGEDPYLAGHR